MFPAFAGLLPGLIQAGGKFLKRTAGDILAGKNVLQSAKANAVEAANEVIPGAGDLLEKGINAVGSYIKGRKDKKKALTQGKFASKAGLSALKEILKDMRGGPADTAAEEATRKSAARDHFARIIQRGSAADKKQAKKYASEMNDMSPGYVA